LSNNYPFDAARANPAASAVYFTDSVKVNLGALLAPREHFPEKQAVSNSSCAQISFCGGMRHRRTD
jgi:hypothetical protein